MSALSGRPFLKMNGCGNEIVVLDLRGSGIAVAPGEARAIAAGDGLAFDQLMVIADPNRPGTTAFVRIFNNDGSEAEACGNGTRCVGWYLMRDGGPNRIEFETRAGGLTCEQRDAFTFTVDMGVPRFAWDEIPLREAFADTRAIELQIGPIDAPVLHTPSAVNMGNPHAIFWVADVDAHDLARFGPLLENHPIFPQRANISLAQVVSPDRIVVKVWERGAGLTRACGTAACAVAVAAARKGLAARRATVVLPGGELSIDWRATDGHVLMTGPVELEFEGRLSPDLFRDTAP